MKKDTKTGFIVTYFHNSEQGLELLKENLEILSREDYYLIIASHSPLDVEIQKMADYYFFQSKNIVDDRKYSHGVAESNLIEISLKHLKDEGIDWTYKVTYDIKINDVCEFNRWDKKEYLFVSCNWGSNVICTNSFFSNVDFLLENIRFYRTIDEMFSVNNVLENCWEHDIRSKNLLDKVYSFKDKQDFYGVNQIDILYYDYNQIDFWYSEEEEKFYIKSSSDFTAHIRIFDYYSDICIYVDRNFNFQKDIIFWILPPYSGYLKKSKNGFYLEVYLPERTIVKNILVNDFDLKHKLSKKFKLIKNTEVKFNEYGEFDDFSLYGTFNIDIESVNNFLDVGSCYGLASIPFISKGIKTYLVEADVNNVEVINRMFSNNSKIKVIDKAITSFDGNIDFWMTSGVGSVVSSIYEVDANGRSDSRVKITVDAITPNTLFNEFIDENSIDLMKVDIEGAEYDFFETITDENLKRVKRMIIEFHNNSDYRVMNIIKKITLNDFKFKLLKWSGDCGDYVVENKMGIIYAEKLF